jgi:hypothetical protein
MFVEPSGDPQIWIGGKQVDFGAHDLLRRFFVNTGRGLSCRRLGKSAYNDDEGVGNAAPRGVGERFAIRSPRCHS